METAGCCGLFLLGPILTGPTTPLGKVATAIADKTGVTNNMATLADPKASAGQKIGAGANLVETVLSLGMLAGGGEGPASGAGEILPPELPATPEASLGDRATEIHQAVPAATQSRTTIAVGEGTDANGNSVRVVGSSEPALRPAQRSMLKSGEVEAKGAGHAEVTVANHAAQNGITLNSVGASRPICPSCFITLQDLGIQPTTSLRK